MARGPLAGAAGPGKFSKRTDGMRLPSAGYGEGVETAAIQGGAPLAKTPSVNPTSLSEQGMAPSQIPARGVDLFAPTQDPNQPITTGIAMGPGAGPEALGITGVTQEKLSDVLAKMLPYDQSGEVEILYQRALARGM